MPRACLGYGTNDCRNPQGCALRQLCPWAGTARLSWHIPLLHGPCPACNCILISVLCDRGSVSSLKGSGSWETAFSITHCFSQSLLHCYVNVLHYSVPIWRRQLSFDSKYCPKLQIHSGKCQQSLWGFDTTSDHLALWRPSWFLLLKYWDSFQYCWIYCWVLMFTWQWRPKTVWLWSPGASSARWGLLDFPLSADEQSPCKLGLRVGLVCGNVQPLGAWEALPINASLQGALSFQLPFRRDSRTKPRLNRRLSSHLESSVLLLKCYNMLTERQVRLSTFWLPPSSGCFSDGWRLCWDKTRVPFSSSPWFPWEGDRRRSAWRSAGCVPLVFFSWGRSVLLELRSGLHCAGAALLIAISSSLSEIVKKSPQK